MSKNFCSFLVSEGSISEADLVQAFISQAESNPSLPKIIRENSLLSEDQILDVYSHQTTHEVSFEQSCRELGFWNSELEQKLEAVIVGNIPSLFRIMIDKDLVQLDDMIVKLDEFISNVIENPEEYGLSAAS